MAGSSSSATVAVEKATSDLLMGPDWTMNIEICDSINSNHWQPKDVVKAVKKRLQHKSSKVQLLALTLLETMVKNCGERVHFQIAERNILGEMIKIVRKKADMHVRDKILLLLDSWQEAFGGPGGKCPQYYWAYEELKRSGVVFPKRTPDAAPIFTPPPTHLTARHMQPGYGMPSSSSKTLDETMATEIESLSFSSLESMQQVLDLLSDMLQAVNPNDREAVKDEVIIDLVDRCRTNQKKLMQMLTTTGDEELLGRGLELNDTIQSLLARHDAIVSGTPFPFQGASSSTLSSEVDYSANQTQVKSSSPVESVSTPNSKASSSALVIADTRGLSDEEDEDEFAQLARRHSKMQSVTSKDATGGSSDNLAPMNTSNATPHVAEPSTSVPSNALALPDPPAPVSTSKDQDIIDLLSLTLSLAPSSPQQTTYTPSASSQGMHQIPAPSGTGTEGYSYAPQTYPGSLPFDSYVVPWAQPQPQSQSQPATPPSHQHLHTPFESEQALHHQQTQPSQSQHQSQLLQSQHQPQSPQALQPQPHSQFQNQHIQYNPPQQMQLHNEPQPLQYQPQPHLQHQPQHHPHFQPHPQPQLQSQPQPQHIQQSQPQPQSQPQHIQQPQPQPQLQHIQQSQPQPQFQNQHFQYPGTYPPPPWAATPGYPNYQNHLSSTNALSTPQANTPYTSAVRGDPVASSGQSNPPNATGQRPFVPSYRLFEDLNVFGNTDGRAKVTGSGTSSSSMSGTMGPGMVGGRK